MIQSLLHYSAEALSFTFIVFIGLLVFLSVCLFLIDITQNKHAIRRNYPLIGRFRYLFEHLGEFFRQYFFAMDREELPFNRAIRNWAYKASKSLNLSLAFGSTHKLTNVGDPVFLHSAFPVLDEEVVDTALPTIGRDCPSPYTPRSFFNISGMSYGALSQAAVTALSHGAEKANCWLNTGEGGVSPFHLQSGCDLVFQIGTANYGVCDKHGRLDDNKLAELAKLEQICMFEIKLSQGAKPGKGGILPAEKVTKEIAQIRQITEGVTSQSPNRRKDVRNNQELLALIQRVKQVTGKPVGIKFVLGQTKWLAEFLQAIKAHGVEYAPDFITLDGAEGGSGAAPQALLDFVGVPLRDSLPLLVQELEQFGLREHIKVIASGKLISPAYVAFALSQGADFVVSARGFMFALGCIQALQCNKNTCPTGITSHNPRLQKGLNAHVKALRVANYHQNMVSSVNMIAHSCGVNDASRLDNHCVGIIGSDGSMQAPE